MDEEGLSWEKSWGIVTRVYSFTNHTVLPEALEKWTVSLLQDLLPRHMMIIYDINLFFLQHVEKKFPGDRDRLRRMSIIEEGHSKNVRMAFLAGFLLNSSSSLYLFIFLVVGSHTINGVAALHSDLIKTEVSIQDTRIKMMILSDFSRLCRILWRYKVH